MNQAHAKNPRRPSVSLTLPDGAVTSFQGPLWRIHTVAGSHPTAWDELRWHGPIRSNRWDPQTGPLSVRSTAGVSYAAPDYTTAFAELFQQDRAITLTAERALSGWRPSRPLDLLNLIGGEGGGDWAVQHGASASLPQAPKDTCRAWAAAIHDQLGDRLDGLLVPSTVTGDPVVVLLSRSVDAFPTAPSFSRNLEHADVMTLAARVRERLGWPIR